MSLNGSGVASKPAGTTAVANTLVESAKFNAVIDDIYEILNNFRPALGGGDMATAEAWLTALGLDDVLTGDIATAAEFRGATTDKVLDTDAVWDAAALVELTDAASIAVDMSTFLNATVTLGGNRALANPTNTTVGKSGVIYVVQDATGSRTMSYGTSYKWAGGTAPMLSTGAGSVDRLVYFVRSATHIDLDLSKDRR